MGTDEKHSPLAALFPPPPPALTGGPSLLVVPSLFPHLKELNLIGLMLGDARMASLWAGLGRLERLEILNLDGNGLTDQSLVALAQEIVGEQQQQQQQQQQLCASSTFASSSTTHGGTEPVSCCGTPTTTPFPRLATLQLSSNQLGDAGVAWLLRALAKANVSLRILDLSDNCLGEELEEEGEEGGREGGLQEVCRALVETEAGRMLEELWLSYNQLTDRSVRGLSKKVIGKGRVPCLQRLELESNHIGNEGVGSLAAALLACSSLPSSSSSSSSLTSRLTSVNLCKNSVGDSGAQALAYSLVHASCPSLSRLDLSGNLIATAGAVALAVALASGRTSLKVLSLAWNDLRDAGMVAFAEELNGRRSREGRRTTEDEERKSVEEEAEKKKVEDEEEEGEEEVGRPWLERLELSNNSIGDKGVQALAAALQSAPPLARLLSIDLTGNDFHELGIGALAAIADGERYCHHREQQEQQEQQEQEQEQWRWVEKDDRGGRGRKKGGRGGMKEQQHPVFPDVRVYDGMLLGDLMGWQSSSWPVKRGGKGREGGGEGGATDAGKAAAGGGVGKGGGDARQLLFRRRQSQRMARREQHAQEQQQQQLWRLQQGLGKGIWGAAWDVVLCVLARAFGGGGGMRALA